MYIATAGGWSTSDEGDPPPCFRQGDLVRLTWVRPDITPIDKGATARLSSFDARTEVVALLSACCDLVIRPDKRKGFLMSPVRDVPKNIAKNPAILAGVKATTDIAANGAVEVPPNLFYFAAVEGSVAEGVIHLEVIVSLDYGFLKAATKVAELTDDARRDLKERLKWHFTRDRPVAPLEATPQPLPELATAVAAGLVAHEVPPVLPPDDR